MTTAEKIRAIEKSGWLLAYDGCHKIYFLQDGARIAQAEEYGYDLFGAEKLRDLILGSCPLVFVSRWGLLGNEDFMHPWNISQSEQDIFEAAKQ